MNTETKKNPTKLQVNVHLGEESLFSQNLIYNKMHISQKVKITP